jgi:hypothetical protein
MRRTISSNNCPIEFFLVVTVLPLSSAHWSDPMFSMRSLKGAYSQSKELCQLDVYPLGRFGKVVESRPPCVRPIWRAKHPLHRLCNKIWSDKLRLFHLFIFLHHTYPSLESIRMDSWEAERNPEKFFGKRGILQESERDVVRRRVASSRAIRELVGAGYTPRLVWLFGIMLRGIIHCTALPKVFEVRFSSAAVPV